MVQKFAALMLASAAALWFSSAARAQETLTISSWLPPHAVNTVIFPEWIKRIEAATDGRVTGKIEFGLAPPPGQIDLIEDGSADVSWIFHGYNPGRFVTTKLIELPGYEGDAEAASVAHWRAYEQHLKDAGEHDGVRVIALMTHGPGQVHMRAPISTLADMQGKKIRIGGGVSADVGAALGVVGVQVPAPEVYETLAGGVADGVWMPMETNKSLRLYEVAPNTMIMPGGLYRGSFAIIMSEDALARLSDEDREAVLSTTGEALSALAGKAWADADVDGIENAKAVGVTMGEFSAEDQEAFGAIADELRARVIDEVAATGVDAEAAVSLIEETMSTYGR
ncbi:MAG: TRAP transporter substrate-binding protein [Rhizobiales bacterium]|nr:TRAP transporter substrate-binding protein [Hyphomicrobiales bacterium]